MTASRGRARLGLLVPFTNTNLEPDFAMMRPDGVSLHVARMGGYDEDQTPDAEQMRGLGEADLAGPLAMLGGARPDVIVYGCTSATLTHGPGFDRQLAAQISTQTGAQTVTAAGALVFALCALGVARVGFASPYVPAINDMAIGFLADMGVSAVARADVQGTLSNEGQGALTPQDVFDLALKADHRQAEALVLSCTDMRSLETLERLEETLGKPVVTSNQAMLYQALCLLGINDPVPGGGRLLRDVARCVQQA